MNYIQNRGRTKPVNSEKYDSFVAILLREKKMHLEKENVNYGMS